MERAPIGCGKEDAIRFLGCSPSMFEELSAKKIIKRVRAGWYSYRMLEEAMQALEEEAKGTANILKLKNHAKGQTVRSKGSGSQDREAEELLFPDQSGGRKLTGT